MTIDPRALAQALGGEVAGYGILAPGPGHSAADRSLSVRLDSTAPDGFIVHSFAGDAAMECRAHVRAAIGSCGLFSSHGTDSSQSIHDLIPRGGSLQRSALALNLWSEGRDPRGTVVATYLASRGLSIPDELAHSVIRFRPKLMTKTGSADCMLALFRDVRTNEPCGIHRTFLDRTGGKLGRKMLGRARSAAIKLNADEHVTLGLHIGEGIESCLAAYLAGFRPVWAVGSANAIAAFPVLPGIEAITILGENDDGGTNFRAACACAKRWTNAGREALAVWPQVGGDFNDVWREAIR